MEPVILYKEKWAPIIEELKGQMADDTRWLETTKLAANIAVDLLLNKKLNRQTLIKQAYDETIALSNSDAVQDVHLACRRMVDLCMSLDYGPAGAWLGVFCEEILEKYEEAQYWYNKAANFGNGIGMYRVGLLYLHKKVPLPRQTSLERCFSDALAHGVSEAQTILDTYFR